VTKRSTTTRQEILCAGLRVFAERGYAGASIEAITAAARVSKPALYYYFGSKAGLFRALVDWAYDECHAQMQSAASSTGSLSERLTAFCVSLFEFAVQHRDLMRLSFATPFASKGEVPREAHCLEKGRRNFEVIHRLIRDGLASRLLEGQFASLDLAMAFYGMVHMQVMAHLVQRSHPLNRQTAATTVNLFLSGAGKQKAESEV